MSFIGGAWGSVVGGPRFGHTRGRIQGSPSSGLSYPSPFFDIAHTYLPATVKHLFRWCRYYFLTNPLINCVTFKLSQYPITDLVIDHESEGLREWWTNYLQRHLRYRPFQAEVGLDYYVYGNAFISLVYPFRKLLICSSCKAVHEAKRIRKYWVFTSQRFRLTCPKCGKQNVAQPYDHYIKDPSGVRLRRWNPENIQVDHNELTGETTYYYQLSQFLTNEITIGKKSVVECIPQAFIDAVRQQKNLVLNQSELFHFKRPSLADQDRGWGIPLLLPVLKDLFYLQIMRKAQEAICLEAILPMRVLFPQPASGSADPFTSVNLVDWRDHVAQEIARWRWDPNYVAIMPLPIGQQTIGGDGKALLLTGEIVQWSDQIIMGMGVPLEFVKGGASWAGTNLSMRMVENFFLEYLGRHRDLIDWIVTRVAAYLDKPKVDCRFKPFKMADDLQRKAYLAQLNASGKISDTTLLADADLNQEDENKLIVRESAMRIEAMKKQQLAVADIQGESTLIMGKWQVKAQQEQQKAMVAPPAQGEPGGPEAAGVPQPGEAPPGQESPAFSQAVESPLNGGQSLEQNGQLHAGVDLPGMAMAQAKLIASWSPEMQQVAINNLQAQSPDLADLVVQILKGLQKGQEGQANGAGVDQRPLPEAAAPRRQTQLV